MNFNASFAYTLRLFYRAESYIVVVINNAVTYVSDFYFFTKYYVAKQFHCSLPLTKRMLFIPTLMLYIMMLLI